MSADQPDVAALVAEELETGPSHRGHHGEINYTTCEGDTLAGRWRRYGDLAELDWHAVVKLGKPAETEQEPKLRPGTVVAGPAFPVAPDQARQLAESGLLRVGRLDAHGRMHPIGSRLPGEVDRPLFTTRPGSGPAPLPSEPEPLTVGQLLEALGVTPDRLRELYGGDFDKGLAAPVDFQHVVEDAERGLRKALLRAYDEPGDPCAASVADLVARRSGGAS